MWLPEVAVLLHRPTWITSVLCLGTVCGEPDVGLPERYIIQPAKNMQTINGAIRIIIGLFRLALRCVIVVLL